MQDLRKKTSTSSLTRLTADNYYDVATDWQYLSPTVYKRFLKCEAEALAELKGEWNPNQDQTPLLVGNYLHSYFESHEAHSDFVEAHKDDLIAKSGKYKGQLKNDYRVAQAMIDALDNDEKFNDLYVGAKEQIVTGEIDGVDWKGKIDCLNLERGYFVDLKTTQDLHKRYYNVDLRSYVPFVTQYNYQLQMAVYQELIEQQYGVQCTPIIIAVTKQDPPDKAALMIPPEELSYAYSELERYQDHVLAVINGQVKPARCENCDYCRATKSLGQIININDLIS
ncbi:phage regulatory protein [Secundilactobacillus oryzae JCM 18671]|uniref:Phage regulatory protein n=1 Tax=Secundilactobacillus oryzae JCM 18671 TaxID=1291743 RepID=A0A081BI78_9LACO|nr:PD-(D/E)XK nuclease-like domain-containing protein [Secundilactobacillus oryzae]GAK47746.1 phage regulatory protein [Secundilactobacillus oryzae JCM 18671]